MFYALEIESLFGYFFIFCRLGGLLMLMPGFGENFIPARLRLLFAFVLTLVITPVISIPPLYNDILSPDTLIILAQEIIVGLFLGVLSRIFLNALQITANIMGLHTSLSSAVMFNPALGSQDSVVSGIFMMGATTLIFATETHHLIIESLVRSYTVFPLMDPLPLPDLNKHVVDTVAQSFKLGVQLSFPVMIVATVLNVASGLLNRLMPQMQVFFMVMPLQILSGFMLIGFSISLVLNLFINHFQSFLQNL